MRKSCVSSYTVSKNRNCFYCVCDWLLCDMNYSENMKYANSCKWKLVECNQLVLGVRKFFSLCRTFPIHIWAPLSNQIDGSFLFSKLVQYSFCAHEEKCTKNVYTPKEWNVVQSRKITNAHSHTRTNTRTDNGNENAKTFE